MITVDDVVDTVNQYRNTVMQQAEELKRTKQQIAELEAAKGAQNEKLPKKKR